DPCQLQQVILNLAVNSRDAMYEKGGTLALETRAVVLDEENRETIPDIQPGLYAMVAVSDSGVGMDAETQDRLFEPFFTTKQRGKGTGLGLTTVYSIVKQSGGDIHVDSELGQGTTFRIYFPATDQEARLPRRDLQPSVVEGSEHILVADDELIVRKLAKRILDRAGYRVQVASDATEAVEILERVEDPIDLLLTDIMMPDKKGTELAEEVRRRHPETRILYTSGYTDDVIVQDCILDHDVHFLSKPFTVEDLVGKVREALES
ncbi:MAG: response regulator, partial [Holophagales bacterium]|nr:response regulator [Holophagales bacterium]